MSDAVPPMCKIAKINAIWTTASPSAEVVDPVHISR